MTEKMKPEIKTAWIEALRSGDFTQARQVLHDPRSGGFCCLGVLSVLTGVEWIYDEPEDDHEARIRPYLKGVDTDSDNENLTTEQCEMVGLDEETTAKLAEMNDGRKDFTGGHSREPQSFTQIADWIEENL